MSLRENDINSEDDGAPTEEAFSSDSNVRRQDRGDRNPSSTAESRLGSSPGRYVFELNRHDILLGRGPSSFNFEGNFRFREVADRYRDEYRRTDSTQMKNRIAMDIIEEIRKRGGRFVRRVNDEEKLRNLGVTMADVQDDCEDDRAKVWEIVNKSEAIDKIKQTLRGLGISRVKAAQREAKANPARRDPKIKDDNQVQGEPGLRPQDVLSITQQLQSERERNQQLQAQLTNRDTQIQNLELQLSRFVGGTVGRPDNSPSIIDPTAGYRGLGIIFPGHHQQHQKQEDSNAADLVRRRHIQSIQNHRGNVSSNDLLHRLLNIQQNHQSFEYFSNPSVQVRNLLESYLRSNLNTGSASDQMLINNSMAGSQIATNAAIVSGSDPNISFQAKNQTFSPVLSGNSDALSRTAENDITKENAEGSRRYQRTLHLGMRQVPNEGAGLHYSDDSSSSSCQDGDRKPSARKRS